MTSQKQVSTFPQVFGTLLFTIRILLWFGGYLSFLDDQNDVITTKDSFVPAFYGILGGSMIISGVFLIGIHYLSTVIFETRNSN